MYQCIDKVCYKESLMQLFLETLKKTDPDVQLGARVAFLTPHNASYVICQWAIWLLGAINVPLCPQHPPSEIEYVLDNSQTTMVISTSKHFKVAQVYIVSTVYFVMP